MIFLRIIYYKKIFGNLQEVKTIITNHTKNPCPFLDEMDIGINYLNCVLEQNLIFT